MAIDSNNPQTFNRYAYVGNTPLTATDPLGLWGWTDVFGSAKNPDAYGYSDLALQDIYYNNLTNPAPSPNLGALGNWAFGFLGSVQVSEEGSGLISESVAYGWSFTSSVSFVEPAAFQPTWMIEGYSNNAANKGLRQQQPAQEAQHFWKKPGCSEALGELGIGLTGTAITVGAIVASAYLGPEIFEGVEGLMTISHLSPVGAPGLVLTVQGGAGVVQKCF